MGMRSLGGVNAAKDVGMWGIGSIDVSGRVVEDPASQLLDEAAEVG